MKILVVEDDERSAAYLKRALSEHGFSVDVSLSGDHVTELALQFKYDLLILDILLPSRDGWSILEHLRHSGNNVPTVFVSGLSDVSHRVKGLQLGADDYISKPFAFSELLARVHSVLRRGSTRRQDSLRVGDLDVDVVRNKATRAGTTLPLTRKEFQLLSLLARHPGDVFSRTVIADQIWDLNFESNTNVVEVHVRRLRSKVDDPFSTKLIHTVRGLGYVLEERPSGQY